jgi:hypothetical protein
MAPHGCGIWPRAAEQGPPTGVRYMGSTRGCCPMSCGPRDCGDSTPRSFALRPRGASLPQRPEGVEIATWEIRQQSGHMGHTLDRRRTSLAQPTRHPPQRPRVVLDWTLSGDQRQEAKRGLQGDRLSVDPEFVGERCRLAQVASVESAVELDRRPPWSRSHRERMFACAPANTPLPLVDGETRLVVEIGTILLLDKDANICSCPQTGPRPPRGCS